MVVVVNHRLRNVRIFDARLQRIQVALGIWDIVEVYDLAFVLGMADLDTHSAP